MRADGGHDIHRQLNLSGEPLIPPLQKSYALRDPMSLLEYHALTIEGRDYEAAYADYWNATAHEDGQSEFPSFGSREYVSRLTQHRPIG